MPNRMITNKKGIGIIRLAIEKRFNILTLRNHNIEKTHK